jgi:RNA-binding protein
MSRLTSSQRRYLRSQANSLKPLVMVGKQGVTDTVVESADKALAAHELIKVRFIDRKDEKRALADELAERTGSEEAGLIGHVLILYRPHEDPEKRQYDLPVV